MDSSKNQWGQKEKENKNKNKKQQQEAFNPNIEENPDIENPLQNNQKDVKEIVEFWTTMDLVFRT
nr:hypothetical protein [Priestia megaterium]